MAEVAGSADSWLKKLEAYSTAVKDALACERGALDESAARQTFNELRAAALSLGQVIDTMKHEAPQAIEAACYLRAMLDVVMLDLREKAAAKGMVLPCLDSHEDA